MNATKRLAQPFLICLVGMMLLFCTPVAHAQERILRFESDIQVNPDSTMTVTETITVRCENNQIRHGIYRDFPTVYRGRTGMWTIVGFNVKKVLRDGHTEPYSIKERSNGKRVYIGDKNRYVPRGVHTYVLTYETNRQLGYFKNHDELYWNVTGNGWMFPIDNSVAKVRLPGDAVKRSYLFQGYTGP